MSTGAIVAIVVAAIVVIVVVALLVRRAQARRRLRQERLSEQVGGHRQEAELHAGKAQELAAEQQGKEG